MMNAKHLLVAAGLSMLILSSNSSAAILVAQTRTTPVLFGGATYTVDFNGDTAGGQVFNFSTSSPNTRIVLTFNAECAVYTEAFNWLDVDILVDPAGATPETAAPPSNDDNAFCSGNHTPGDDIFGAGDGWVSATTQATMILPQAGKHTVRVVVNGAKSGVARLDDMSLIVQR
ncbi:MAG: hypothetical protein ACREYF_26570 [Gammaproteobacteria bacterium]